jgi:hypothetical protein
MKSIILLSTLVFLPSCKKHTPIEKLLLESGDVLEAVKYMPESYEDIQQALVSMGTSRKDYADCINDLSKMGHDYYRLKYKSDGFRIESFIGLPKGFDNKKKYPLIINNRGGNRNYGKIDACGLYFGDTLFNLLGDSVIYSSEVRGTTGSEGKDEFGGSIKYYLNILLSIRKTNLCLVGREGQLLVLWQ